MKHNELTFNEARTEAWIRFADNSVSAIWSSKSDAIDVIFTLYTQGNLPEDQTITFIEYILDSQLYQKEGTLLVIKINKTVIGKPDKVRALEDPSFQLCDCEQKLPHGHIVDKNGELASTALTNKQQAYAHIEHLLLVGMIKEQDIAKLRTLVSCAKIPDSLNQN